MTREFNGKTTWTGPGINDVGAYQISGNPWVTGSLTIGISDPLRISFPAVSNHFLVHNTGGSDLHVGFTANGVSGSNYFTVEAAEVQRFDLRVRDIFLLGVGATTADVLGGLTSIRIPGNYPPITSSNPPPTGSQYLPGVG